MGVDCRWRGHAPMELAAKACGLLMGCRKSFDPQWGWVNVAGVKTAPTTVPTLGEILITLSAEALPDWDVNGTGERMLYWHHEGPGGSRLLSTRAVPCNVALVRALGRLFGGTVTLEDTGGTPDEEYPAPAVDLWAEDAEDDREWYQVQALLAGIRPLTPEDFAAVRAYAAYDGGR